MKSRIKILIGLAAGVALGAVLPVLAAGPDGPRGSARGANCDREGHVGAGPGRKAPDFNTTRMLSMLDKRLDLSDEQESQIRGILDETRTELKAQMEEIRGKVKASREGIEKVLTEDQRKKFGKAAGQLFAGVGGFAGAHGPALRERMRPAGEQFHMRSPLTSLDLTDEQREKLRAHRKAMREKHEALRKEMEPKVQALREEAKKELESILTPEQREQLKECLERHPAGRGGDPRRGEGGLMQRWREGRKARVGGPNASKGHGDCYAQPGPLGTLTPPPPPDGGSDL